MSQAVNHIPFASIAQQSLAQCFSSFNRQDQELCVFELTQNTLITGSELKLSETLFPLASPLNNDQQSSISQSTNAQNSSAIELVVFDNITLETLLKLTQATSVSICGLNKINHRNDLTSYRFSVICDELSAARQALVNFVLTKKIEAALIENAPQLTTPGLLVMDMDSTTIEIECIDEIAALAGVGEQVAEVTELAMQGKLDFAQSLHQRVATLSNAPESILASVAKDIPLMPGLENLVTILQEHQWRIAIASGGFTYFSEHLKEMLGLDATFANTLEIIDGKLTGKVLGDVVDAQAKADTLSTLSKRYNISERQTVAMGDGANDLVMMAAAYLGVAYKAKPIVLEQADTTVNYSGLDCLVHWLA